MGSLQLGWMGIHLGPIRKASISTDEFTFINDGDPISETTCQRVASAIEAALPSLEEEDHEWLQPHIALWRTCGGYQQY